MIIPSSQTVIRFVAFYRFTFAVPATHIVLGHGHVGEGASHSQLALMYRKASRKDIDSHDVDTYAGYLYVEGGEVKIHSGGSTTLKIPQDTEKDSKFIKDLDADPLKFKSWIIRLFPLIIDGSPESVMLAR